MENHRARQWLKTVRSLIFDETGSELVEYCVVLAVFAIAMIVALKAVPQTANNQFNTDENNFSQSLANGY